MTFDDDAGHPHCPPVNDRRGEALQSATQESAKLAFPASVSCSDCLLFGDYSIDGRDGQVKVKDAKSIAPIAITNAVTAFTYAHRTALRNGARCRFATPGASPPLNLLHCVHLK